MTHRTDSRTAIVAIARTILAEAGFRALTFDAVARRMGVTKQAVIYWFPSKQMLLREIVLPWIEAEADAVATALSDVRSAPEAIHIAIDVLVTFHLADLTRFRQIYLALQLDPRPQLLLDARTMRTHVHPVSARLYGAIERALAADPRLRPGLHPRRAALTLHMAVLGLVAMVGLAEAIDDPLAHATGDLADTLVALLVDGAMAKS